MQLPLNIVAWLAPLLPLLAMEIHPRSDVVWTASSGGDHHPNRAPLENRKPSECSIVIVEKQSSNGIITALWQPLMPPPAYKSRVMPPSNPLAIAQFLRRLRVRASLGHRLLAIRLTRKINEATAWRDISIRVDEWPRSV